MDLFAREASTRIRASNTWARLGVELNWSAFEPLLKRGLNRSGYGPQGYDPLTLFKCLLLGQWHSLSDSKLEEALEVRLDFAVFCDFNSNDTLPDKATHCRFRTAIFESGVIDELLAEANRQLEAMGKKVNVSEKEIVDSTVITSAARPRRVPPKGLKEDENVPHDPKVCYSADPDASWTWKHSKYMFGYKGFIRSDDEGFIDKVHTTTAKTGEHPEFETIIEGSKAERILADKGYASKANRKLLSEKNYKDGIMRKAARNRRLRGSEKRFNKAISKWRFRVEQCFGTMKRLFGLSRARYFGCVKTHGQLTMAALAQNLLKALNKTTKTSKTLAAT